MCRLFVLPLLIISLISLPVSGAAFDPDNILVTEDNVLYEYTQAGAFVQSFPIPHPDTTRHEGSDIAVDPTGAAHIRNIAPFEDDYFSRLDPTTGDWTHVVSDGIGAGNVSDKDISIRGPIAVTNGRRFDTTTSISTPFSVPGFGGAGEVSWGMDGLLYALDSGSPRADVRIMDPSDFSLIREVQLLDSSGSRLDARGIAVTPAGQMFVADWDGMIYEFAPDATLIQSQPTGANDLTDIDINELGALVVGSRFGYVIITDTTLASMNMFRVAGSGNSYVSFAKNIPEPTAITVLMLTAIWTIPKRTYSRG